MQTPNPILYHTNGASEGMDKFPSLMETARLAHGLTTSNWNTLNSPTITDPVNVCYSYDASVLIDRIYSLLLIRILALICCRSRTTSFSPWQPLPWFLDLSTSTICHTLLTKKNEKGGDWEWPVIITSRFMGQLKDYVSKIVSLYRNVPYHNFEHAYHVLISANKLLDLVLCEYDLPPLPPLPDKSVNANANANANANEENGIAPTENEANGTTTTPTINISKATADSTSYTTSVSKNGKEETQTYSKKPFRPTYGIKRDPLLQLAYLFSALVHDVEHTGVTNRQLVLEGDELAIMYNDQSVAEQRSLAVAFSLIRESQYSSLRKLLFEHGEDGKPGDSYMRFRSTVIDLVLCTDIASPERVQIVKSKWKEVFGNVEKRNGNEVKRNSAVWANGTTHGKNKIQNIERLNELKPTNDSNEHDRSLLSEFLGSRVSLQGGEAIVDNNLYDSCSSTSSGHDRESSWSSKDTHFDRNGLMVKQQKDFSLPNVHKSWPNNKPQHNEMSDTRLRKRARLSMSEIQRKRMSNPSASAFERKSFHVRLGIRRTLDLDGAAIEPFRASQTLGEMVGDTDRPNDLKVIVVLEQMMKAADISTNLQCWDNMISTSNRLFKEQRRSFSVGRGDNPEPGWFDNQRAFIESYTLPLARHLVESGVFQKDFGQLLVNSAEQNRARWLEEGSRVCSEMVAGGRRNTLPSGI